MGQNYQKTSKVSMLTSQISNSSVIAFFHLATSPLRLSRLIPMSLFGAWPSPAVSQPTPSLKKYLPSPELLRSHSPSRKALSPKDTSPHQSCNWSFPQQPTWPFHRHPQRLSWLLTSLWFCFKSSIIQNLEEPLSCSSFNVSNPLLLWSASLRL